MAKPKIEELRKKAFVLYNGPRGPELVNREIKKFGIKEDKLNEYQLKIVLNNIVKNVFVDYVGLDEAKKALSKDVTHLPGYRVIIEEETDTIHIFERSNFNRIFMMALIVIVVFVVGYLGYYMTTFNKGQSCEAKKDAVGRDACFLSVAIGTGNTSMCDKLSSIDNAYNCYSVVARRRNDTGICDKIPGRDIDLIALHDNCRMCVAITLKNRTLCTSFMNPNTEAECLTQMDRKITLTC